MCGIVSYVGKRSAKEILLQGLKSLEYRGYDSSGIAVLDEACNIEIRKIKGKVSDLEASLESSSVDDTESHNNSFTNSHCGIGHTRWATHGEPSELNAHPHQDRHSEVALVHNGIISNYLELKRELEAEGVMFKSDTDTEIISELFAKNKHVGGNKSDLEALRKTIQRLKGSYAIALVSRNSKKILVAKNESPLVIGIGDGENFVASDSATVLQFTDKILRLKDLELAEITDTEVKVEDIDGNQVKSEIHQLIQTSSLLEKGAYKHFLLKEIHEQPAVISKILTQLDSDTDNEFDKLCQYVDVKQLRRIIFVACGSAYHASLIGKYLIEQWAGIPTEVFLASEFHTFGSETKLINEKDLVIGVSQSGETADTLGAIKNAKKLKAKVFAITNKKDSAIVELCDARVYVTPAGIEVSVATTKAFTSQVMSLYLLALKLAEVKGMNENYIKNITRELHKMPQLLDQVIERSEAHKESFIKYSKYRDFIFLSRGINYPIALEGALKLKELSYIHATGYASGEMKHGPIAILDQNVPVLNIAINGDSELEQNIYNKTLHNAEEARARKSPSLAIVCDSNKDVDGIFDEVIKIPDVSQLLSPIVAVVPLQYLAYYIAEDLGHDVDQPRNLAKSVTVE